MPENTRNTGHVILAVKEEQDEDFQMTFDPPCKLNNSSGRTDVLQRRRPFTLEAFEDCGTGKIRAAKKLCPFTFDVPELCNSGKSIERDSGGASVFRI